MNTTITIKVVKDKEPTVQILDAIEGAFGEFDRIVKKFTRFNENSELSNLNRQSSTWVKVSDELLWLINYSLDMSKKTAGAFDPTIIDFLEIYGYDKNYDFSKLDNPDLDKFVEKIAKERASWKDIQIKNDKNLIKLVKGQRIDLGGVGKGYAIDCAFEKLNKIESFLIDAGGDIRVKGKNENDEAWSVALKNKKIDGEIEIIGKVELNNESIASSGSWARQVRQFHHLINPATGKPQNNFRTVYVQADTGIKSDSWATAIFVGGENLQDKISSDIKYFFVK